MIGAENEAATAALSTPGHADAGTQEENVSRAEVKNPGRGSGCGNSATHSAFCGQPRFGGGGGGRGAGLTEFGMCKQVDLPQASLAPARREDDRLFVWHTVVVLTVTDTTLSTRLLQHTDAAMATSLPCAIGGFMRHHALCTRGFTLLASAVAHYLDFCSLVAGGSPVDTGHNTPPAFRTFPPHTVDVESQSPCCFGR